jgi:predicted metal-binding protein
LSRSNLVSVSVTEVKSNPDVLVYCSQCIKYGQKTQHCPSKIYSILVILHFEKL